MFLVKPKVELLAISGISTLPYEYNNPNPLIEYAGRTCYKSENKISDESTEIFIHNIELNAHYSVMEHSWEYKYYETFNVPIYPYLNYMSIDKGVVVAGNKRAFKECCFDQIKTSPLSFSDFYSEVFKQQAWNMLSASVKYICDRGVTHELVRHRPVSYSQESTRYCNYSKNKFNNELTFVIPPWLNVIKEGQYSNIVSAYKINEDIPKAGSVWMRHLFNVEETYMKLVTEHNWAAQEARSVLPNCLKTEIVVTTDLNQWKHMFSLRTSENPKAHVQIQEIMNPTKSEFMYVLPHEIFEGI
jgi:thymidylate synthase (FAD)